MASLGSLWYQLGIKDMTDADLQKINAKLKKLGEQIELTPKILKSLTQAAVPTGIKIELDPKLKDVSNEALAKAVEGKVMKVEVSPLITHLRKDLKDATKDNPPEIEVGVQTAKFRKLIETVLNRHGFMINIDTVNDNYTKVVQQKLNGTPYKVKIHADAKEITQSVQASLMQVQSRRFGLQITKDVLHKSIDKALMGKKFPISVYVKTENARSAVQTALNKAAGMSSQEILNHNRLMKAEAAAAAAELNRVKAAHIGAADAAKVHASASIDLGGIMGSNIKIAGELGSAMASMYSIHALKEFMSQVVEIGGELEHQKIAMDTIFGDKGKTNELFGQIKGLARQSPFGVMELTKNVKQLSAYGVQYNEIYETSKRLADISAATSVDISRLILAFGKTKSRGFLDGLEAKQFAYANIPIYEMVRKKLEELEGQAVTTADVMARMKKREIGFDIVKDVLWDMTDPGGKFYNMQEALAGSVKTSWKLVRDNIELMFGEVAESWVGGGLKDVAVILQGLTREWRTLGVVVASGVAVFGAYKVAVALSNRVMGEANALGVQKALTSNKVAAANAIEAQSYRVLTQAEDYAILSKSGLQKLNRSLFLSHRALTEAEWDAVIASKAVNKDYILRRIALGRLTQAEVEYLVSIEAVTRAEAQRAASAANLKISLASLWAMMKQTTAWNWLNSFGTKAKGISMSGIWGGFLSSMQSVPGRFKALTNQLGQSWMSFTNKVRTFTWAGFVTGAKNGFKSVTRSITHAEVGVTQLKLAFAGLGRMMSSIGAFLLNPVTLTMAAIGGLMYAWQKNNEEMDKAKEFGDNLFTKATEGAKNLSKAMTELPKSSEDLGDVTLQSGIDKLKELIKDYSDTPKSDIAASLINQQGEVATLAEQYEALLATVNNLIVAYKEAERLKLGEVLSEAIKGADSGWLDDNLTTDITNYKDAWGDTQKEITKYAQKYREDMIKAVDAAKKADTGFEEAVKGMHNYEAMYAELVRNADKYDTAITELRRDGGDVYEPVRLGHLTYHGAASTLKKAERELLSEWEQTLNNVKTQLLMKNVDVDNMSAPLKQSLITAFNKAMEGAEGPAKKQMENMINKVFPSIKLTNDDLSITIAENFADALKKASPQLANEMRYGKPFKELSEAQKSLIENLMKQAGEETKRAFPDYADELQQLLDTSDFTAKIYLDFVATQQASSLQKMLWKNVGVMSPEVTRIFEGWTKGADSVNAIGDNAVKEGKEVKARLEAAKKNAHSTKEHIQELQNEWDDAALAYKNAGFGSLEDAIKSRGKSGSEKDAFAEGLKQRFKDIKDAWSEFQKWSKTEGRDAAATRIGESGLFSTLSADQIPKTIEDYRALVKGLEDELRNAGVKGTARESLLNELLKQLLDIDKTVVDEQLKLALDTVTKEAERQIADWNLFDKIRKATGNQDLAMSVAFGMNADAETDYPTLVKTQFADLAKKLGYDLTFDNTTLEQAQNLGDDIAKSYKDTADKLEKYAREQKDSIADILNEYQSLTEKLAKIDADREQKIDVVNKSDLKEPDKAALRQRINAQADYEKFQQSNDYLQFFSGIYSLTMDKAQEIGDKIRYHLNEQLQAGKLSAEDYYKEIERINQQLTKLRNVKSNALTFATSGVKGLNQKKLDKADSDILQQMSKVKDAEEELAKAKASGNQKDIAVAEVSLKLAKQSLATYEAVRNAIVKNTEKWQNIADVTNITANIAGGMSDAFNTLRDMADSFGFDTESGAWQTAAAVMDTLTTVTGGVQKVVQSAMSGDIGGMISGAFDTVLTPITIWNKLHDSKLQKQIEQEQKIYKLLESQLSLIAGELTYALGSTRDIKLDQAEADKARYEGYLAKAQKYDAVATDKSVPILVRGVAKNLAKANRQNAEKYEKRYEAYETGGAYGYQRQLMVEQRESLEKQRKAEADKKKSSSDALAEYDNQIASLNQEIRDFAETTIETLYGINVRSWAEDIGSALIDAFAKGEDAAKAFDDAVADIMRDVVKNMAIKNILEKQFEGMRTYMFGEDGMSGAFGKDFYLDESEAAGLKKYFDTIKNVSIPAIKNFFDGVNDAMDGLLNETESAKSGLSVGIQGITEDTADLLASYVNAIRADVSVSRMNWDKLLDTALPQMNVIAEAQLTAQRQIAENTLRNAVAAEAILKSNESIYRLLSQATNGATRFYVH